jgi:hypothetical protein
VRRGPKTVRLGKITPTGSESGSTDAIDPRSCAASSIIPNTCGRRPS